MEYYIAVEKALDPKKYCIILPNQLGGGLSTSSHNILGTSYGWFSEYIHH